MQQFVRVLQGEAVIPALVGENGLLDLRSLIADITPETIASGVLNEVKPATLSPLAGDVQYLAPIGGVRQIPATGFNYKKHIEEMKHRNTAEKPDPHVRATRQPAGEEPFQRARLPATARRRALASGNPASIIIGSR